MNCGVVAFALVFAVFVCASTHACCCCNRCCPCRCHDHYLTSQYADHHDLSHRGQHNGSGSHHGDHQHGDDHHGEHHYHSDHPCGAHQHGEHHHGDHPCGEHYHGKHQCGAYHHGDHYHGDRHHGDHPCVEQHHGTGYHMDTEAVRHSIVTIPRGHVSPAPRQIESPPTHPRRPRLYEYVTRGPTAAAASLTYRRAPQDHSAVQGGRHVHVAQPAPQDRRHQHHGGRLIGTQKIGMDGSQMK